MAPTIFVHITSFVQLSSTFSNSKTFLHSHRSMCPIPFLKPPKTSATNDEYTTTWSVAYLFLFVWLRERIYIEFLNKLPVMRVTTFFPFEIDVVYIFVISRNVILVLCLSGWLPTQPENDQTHSAEHPKGSRNELKRCDEQNPFHQIISIRLVGF